MTFADPQSKHSFDLSDGADGAPIVHRIANSTTRTYQYIVADPSTKKCVIIDPKHSSNRPYPPIQRNHKTKRSFISSTSTLPSPDSVACTSDPILSCIAIHGYIVSHILETHSLSPGSQASNSTAWSLRMHLLTTQGFPPSLCGGRVVASMRRVAACRYGADYRLHTTLTDAFRNGQRFSVGKMTVVVLLLPGLDAGEAEEKDGGREPRTGFLIGKNLFGAMQIADLQPEEPDLREEGANEGEKSRSREVRRRWLWASWKKVLYLDEDTVVHAGQFEEEGEPAEMTVKQCRVRSRYGDLVNERDFVRRRGMEAEMVVPGDGCSNAKSKWAFFRRSQ